MIDFYVKLGAVDSSNGQHFAVSQWNIPADVAGLDLTDDDRQEISDIAEMAKRSLERLAVRAFHRATVKPIGQP